MTILVTGCGGFLGINLCRTLLRAGHSVLGLDNYSTGARKKLQELQSFANFTGIEADVTEPFPADLPSATHIYNLACPASPPHYQKDPVKTMRTSIWGAWHVLEYARRHKSVVLQASTSEVYGDPKIHPQSEDYVGHVNPIGIRACYDEGKRAAEAMFFDYHRQYGLAIKVIRIFNTYGPGMNADDGRVVSNFVIKALRQQPIEIYGDGSQTRSFCYIDDLIDGMIRMMNSDPSVTGPINLGNPDEFTMLQLAQKIKLVTASDSPIIFKSLPSDDPQQRQPDITRAQKLLGWSPAVGIDAGLQKTADYFASLLDEPKTTRAANG
jgi:UDP-glucuronate decarboxylase